MRYFAHAANDTCQETAFDIGKGRRCWLVRTYPMLFAPFTWQPTRKYRHSPGGQAALRA